jgi:hypothetical protein
MPDARTSHSSIQAAEYTLQRVLQLHNAVYLCYITGTVLRSLQHDVATALHMRCQSCTVASTGSH